MGKTITTIRKKIASAKLNLPPNVLVCTNMNVIAAENVISM